MSRSIKAAALLGAIALAACSPTFNWREVTAPSSDLKAVLPCKPDRIERDLPMLGRTVRLQAIGCEAGGATFAVLYGDIGGPSGAAEALVQWKAASLASLRGAATAEQPFRPAGALGLAQSVKVAARGQRADGTGVESQAAYFARGNHIFQAVIFADRIRAEVADPFFAGLRFQ